jgi:hypothetical protein
MRAFVLFSYLLALLVTAVLAWDKEDFEIFDLWSAVRLFLSLTVGPLTNGLFPFQVEASEGKGTTFYSWLDVPSTATTQEIAKVRHYTNFSELHNNLFILVYSLLDRRTGRRACNSSTSLKIPHTLDLFDGVCSPDKNPNDKKIHERFARLGVSFLSFSQSSKRVMMFRIGCFDHP